MVPGLNRSQFLSPTKAQSPDVQPLRMPGTWQLSEWVSSKTLKISREILEILAKSEFLEILAHPFLVTSSLNLIGMFLNWWFLPEQRSTSMKLGPMSWRSYERSVTCLELVANNTRNKFLKSTNKNNTCSMFLQNTNNKIIPAACFYEIPMTISVHLPMEIELTQRLAEDDNHLRIQRLGVGRSSSRIVSMVKTGEVEESRASFQLWCYFLRSQMSLCLSTANHWSHFKTVWKIHTDWQDGTGLGFSNCSMFVLYPHSCSMFVLYLTPHSSCSTNSLQNTLLTGTWSSLQLRCLLFDCTTTLHYTPPAQTQSTLRDCLPSVSCSLWRSISSCSL